MHPGTTFQSTSSGQRLQLNNAPPVILLHGLNDCSQTCLHIGTVLAQDRQVLIPYLPGHGLSSRPDASYTLDWYA
jgi:pimeloyl-ACP methyl ester carboxylesterase